MKRLLLYLLTLSFGASLATASRAEIDRATFIRLASSVLKIEALRVQGGYALGSGVVVDAERIVTNCHVTREAREIYVLRGGVRWRAVAQLSDLEHDLCVLQVPGMQASVVPLGRADTLVLGQPVTALGYTGGLEIQNSPGAVVAVHRLDGGRVIQSSNWFSSGASGGGLFDDDVRLVGILTFRLRGGLADYFAAPVEWLRTLLDPAQAGNYRAVAPLDPLALPYWQKPLAGQPRFLQAAQLERAARWPELEALATQWLRSDAGDPEPWYLRGLALDQLERPGEAGMALACSLALEPALKAASARLGAAGSRPGPAPSPSQGSASSPPASSDPACPKAASTPP